LAVHRAIRSTLEAVGPLRGAKYSDLRCVHVACTELPGKALFRQFQAAGTLRVRRPQMISTAPCDEKR
jgi:hypothetical protein